MKNINLNVSYEEAQLIIDALGISTLHKVAESQLEREGGNFFSDKGLNACLKSSDFAILGMKIVPQMHNQLIQELKNPKID